jgi:hypothetical protein
MYGGYTWLTNARTPSRAPKRFLLLIGMAGFLVIGLSIPHAFGPAPAAYVLCGAALAIQVLGPVVVRLGARFDIQPAHFVERHRARSRPGRWLWKGALSTLPLKHDRQVHAAGDGPSLV